MRKILLGIALIGLTFGCNQKKEEPKSLAELQAQYDKNVEEISSLVDVITIETLQQDSVYLTKLTNGFLANNKFNDIHNKTEADTMEYLRFVLLLQEQQLEHLHSKY
ncbi:MULTISPECIES: hypothetical protein [Flammeovirga]|uniref:Uncharacterized protein n=1 Tax=Flammeovirga agarivorans TaxID=2726742 RepID=A0A7X8XVR5_9BACT|nr:MULTISPECIES: hypothetical protein [Flammeovirga]NLR91592.1 hypothetical protein [Flammeovirga agarivorans]